MNAEKSPVNHNVDHEEIAKFEAVASRWWDLEGEFKPLHRINPLRLGYIAERAGGLFGKKVLDVGCGGGILAESMAREGATVYRLQAISDIWQRTANNDRHRIIQIGALQLFLNVDRCNFSRKVAHLTAIPLLYPGFKGRKL